MIRRCVEQTAQRLDRVAAWSRHHRGARPAAADRQQGRSGIPKSRALRARAAAATALWNGQQPRPCQNVSLPIVAAMSRIFSASTRGALIGKASSLRSPQLSLKRQSFPFFGGRSSIVRMLFANRDRRHSRRQARVGPARHAQASRVRSANRREPSPFRTQQARTLVPVDPTRSA